jgi:hypothetical protein
MSDTDIYSGTHALAYRDGMNTANERADERIRELEAENSKLRDYLSIAQGTNKALEDWIKGYRIQGQSAEEVPLEPHTSGAQIMEC